MMQMLRNMITDSDYGLAISCCNEAEECRFRNKGFALADFVLVDSVPVFQNMPDTMAEQVV